MQLTPNQQAGIIWNDVKRLNYWGAAHKNTKAVAMYVAEQIINANPENAEYWNDVLKELEAM